ncbi:MAG: hypothetical protein H6Q06_2955, partial [Acidobacteria bacterium]|nr:hypothetical protein [Acidobacteriota bacterium]
MKKLLFALLLILVLCPAGTTA